MSTFEFNVSPKYKKSFVECMTLQKKINEKMVKVTRELVWRTGEFSVTISEEEFKKYCQEKDLKIDTIENNENEIFESLKKDGILIFDNSFPFENEFLSSFDGCSNDYYIHYEDGSDVEDSIEEEINKIIEDGDFYDLEDDHNYDIDDTKYEMHGDLDIQRIN